MAKIHFELDYTLPETGYYCVCCKNSEVDHSGDYYPAADYADLEQRLEEAVADRDSRRRLADLDDDIVKLKSAEIEGLQEIIQALHLDVAERDAEIEKLKDFRGGTIHNSWLTAPREKLIEALQFQGATTKEAFKLADERQTEIMALKAALGKGE